MTKFAFVVFVDCRVVFFYLSVFCVLCYMKRMFLEEVDYLRIVYLNKICVVIWPKGYSGNNTLLFIILSSYMIALRVQTGHLVLLLYA